MKNKFDKMSFKEYCTYKVLNNLLDGRDGEDKKERYNGGVASGGWDVRNLLQQADEEEEAVGVALELLVQEAREEGDHTVLGCRHVVGAETLLLRRRPRRRCRRRRGRTHRVRHSRVP